MRCSWMRIPRPPGERVRRRETSRRPAAPISGEPPAVVARRNIDGFHEDAPAGGPLLGAEMTRSWVDGRGLPLGFPPRPGLVAADDETVPVFHALVDNIEHCK